MKTNILVTGSNGQLGSSIRSIADQYPNLNFIFVDRTVVDITNRTSVLAFFERNFIDWCINCAAYTAVDKAEEEEDIAHSVNVIGVKYLAQACNDYKVKLIHISTDFVFDGTGHTPYTETDETQPINIYGQTKLEGEVAIASILEQHFVLRTSWLYSEFGNNFMRTMLRLSKEKEELKIVNDQIGTPTYAGDLAIFIVKLIELDSHHYGIYHYSNTGVASWYDFAKAIFDLNQISISVIPIPSTDFPTPAIRPKYSVLDKTKVSLEFNIEIPQWRHSLEKALNAFNKLVP